MGYVRAFRKRGTRLAFVRDNCRLNEDIERLFDSSEDRPSLIIQPESNLPLLPRGLDKVDVPTGCFYFDPYAYLHRRVRWAMLFDYVFLFHPGFEEAFHREGHPNPVTIPHAVDAAFFRNMGEERPLDVGWVGRSGGPPYETRRRVLEKLASSFRMNEWKRHHSYEELAEVYSTSKIVVNVGRDDYPIDVSLHFAEAMAGGALFITLLPSEIGELGFQEGVHYLGVRSEGEFPGCVRYYLEHPAERSRIAEAGRQKVLREHTYDDRAAALLRAVEQNGRKLFAPARQWPEERVRLVYLDYFAANGKFDYACAELGHVVRHDVRTAAAGVTLVARAIASKLRNQLNSAVQWSK